jgi:Uma2 family endonuclease
MSEAVKIPVRMSAAEFLGWNPGDGRRWQLVDGEPRAMAPASRAHGAVQSELGRRIGNHLEERGSPCSVITAPGIIPNVRAGFNFRIPDLAVTCSDDETGETAVSGAVLIVEILSPSNQVDTWANVWTYTTIPSVREILVLRTVEVGAELLRRQPDGSWPKEPEAIESGGDLLLESIGLRLPLAALYRTTRLARRPRGF